MSAHYPTPFRLSARERDVLSLMVEGRRNKEIAEVLGIAERTTEHHLNRILQKLRARNRTEATVVALKAGLVQLRPELGTGTDDSRLLLF